MTEKEREKKSESEGTQGEGRVRGAERNKTESWGRGEVLLSLNAPGGGCT